MQRAGRCTAQLRQDVEQHVAVIGAAFRLALEEEQLRSGIHQREPSSSGRERVFSGTRIAPIFSTPKYSAGHGEWLAIHTAT